MRNMVIASIAALASLVVTANMAATAVNGRATHTPLTMAQADRSEPEAAEVWFIKGVITINGEERLVRYVVDDNGQPAVLTFDSKDACEDARANDEDIAGALAAFEAVVASRGGTVVISCEKWEHPE